MVDFRFERSGDIGLLSLNGDLGMHCFEDLMAVLMSSLGNSEHLVIDLKHVKAFDQSFMRLLCVACRTSSKLKKRLTLAGKKTNCSGNMHATINNEPDNCSLMIN